MKDVLRIRNNIQKRSIFTMLYALPGLTLFILIGLTESQNGLISTRNASFIYSSEETMNSLPMETEHKEDTSVRDYTHRGEDRASNLPDFLMVTVLEQSSEATATSSSFSIDASLVSVTVTVKSVGKTECHLCDPLGRNRYQASSRSGSLRWILQSPITGPWFVECSDVKAYNFSVQGASQVDLEISLYQMDSNTGIAELVRDRPTAGHQIRMIIDVLGSNVVNNLQNVTLVTSDRRELASDWLRPTGEPTEAQYMTSFTWPTEAVFIRVFGQTNDRETFERQTSYLITPVLIDLQLLRSVSSDSLRPNSHLQIRYLLTNQGLSDKFALTASVDNEVFQVSVSPNFLQLGHMGSFDGIVDIMVGVFIGTETGLLTLCAQSENDPDVQQVSTRFLTAEDSISDVTPPFCQATSILENCTGGTAMSPIDCELRQWTVNASIIDKNSGVQYVNFLWVQSSDSFIIGPFSEGQVNDPVIVFYNASCCQHTVTLAVSDLAGNEKQCEFNQPNLMITSSPSASISRMITTSPKRPTTRASFPTMFSRATPLTTSSKSTLAKSSVTPTIGESAKPTSVKPTTAKPTSTSTRLATSTQGILRLVGVTVDEAVFDASPKQPTNDTMVLQNLTPSQSKTQESWDDYSTVKIVSIVLGSVGGVAGLAIVVLCFVFVLRYRRQQHLQHDDIRGIANDPGHGNIPDLLSPTSGIDVNTSV